MDEISRDGPVDTTTARASAPRTKGPEELVAFERGIVAEDLVVRARPEPDVSAADPTPAPQPDEPGAADAAPADGVDAREAEAVVAAAEDVAAIEEDLGGDDEEGLPAVPQLADAAAVARMVFVLMLSSREGLSLLRLAQACNTTQKLVDEALALLHQQLQSLGLPVELTRTGDTVKWMSGPDTFPYLQRLRGVKKLEKLSPAALETLAVIAYRQPVMRSEIEAIRGVKAGPMLRTLLHHKLVKVTGRAEVPGRPLQYGTTPQFLERFGLGSLQELPSIKEWKCLG
jgi:segregation and condensation protein B